MAYNCLFGGYFAGYDGKVTKMEYWRTCLLRHRLLNVGCHGQPDREVEANHPSAFSFIS
jgi:hypothetical protein